MAKRPGTLNEANPYEKQTNKHHVKKKEKLEKKKRFRKNRKRIHDYRSELRQIKKKKDIMRKLAIISERFEKKVPTDEIIVIQSVVSKLLSQDKVNDMKEDLRQIFSNLDQGASIDIQNIKDNYTQSKLFKLFKLMRLRKSIDNELSFSKKIGKDIHEFSFEKFIKHVIQDVENDREDEMRDADEDGEDEMVSMDDLEIKESDNKPQSKSKKLNTSTKNITTGKQKLISDIDAIASKKQNFGLDFFEETINMVSKDGLDNDQKLEENENKFANELDSLFKQSKKKSKMKIKEKKAKNL